MKIRSNKSKLVRLSSEPIIHVRILPGVYDQDREISPDNVTLIHERLTNPVSEELYRADIIDITQRINERSTEPGRIGAIRQLATRAIEAFQPFNHREKIDTP